MQKTLSATPITQSVEECSHRLRSSVFLGGGAKSEKFKTDFLGNRRAVSHQILQTRSTQRPHLKIPKLGVQPPGGRDIGGQKFSGPSLFLGSLKSDDIQNWPACRGPRVVPNKS
jgi:hypothetical protein